MLRWGPASRGGTGSLQLSGGRASLPAAIHSLPAGYFLSVGKAPRSLLMQLLGLSSATVQAHQVFDVSIPFLQTPGCHGNAPAVGG